MQGVVIGAGVVKKPCVDEFSRNRVAVRFENVSIRPTGRASEVKHAQRVYLLDLLYD